MLQIKTIIESNNEYFDKLVNEAIINCPHTVVNIKFESDERSFIAHIIYNTEV